MTNKRFPVVKGREWLLRAEQADDAFTSFGDAWRGFNNCYDGHKGGNARAKIAALLRAKLVENKAEQILEKNAAGVTTLIEEPVINMERPHQDTMDDIANFSAPGPAVEKMVSLFSIIYQVRCNLEHGQKSPSRARDRDLAGAASDLVIGVLQIVT